MIDSKNFRNKGSMAQYGLPKSRKCMNCLKEMDDDGSSAWLRGFCSEKCHDDYLAKFRK